MTQYMPRRKGFSKALQGVLHIHITKNYFKKEVL